MITTNAVDVRRMKSGGLALATSILTIGLFLIVIAGVNDSIQILRYEFGHVMLAVALSVCVGIFAGYRKAWIGGVAGVLISLVYCTSFTLYIVSYI